VRLVKEAVNAIAWEGPSSVYGEISLEGGRFHKDDHYVMVYSTNGSVLAHGAKPEWVGHNQISLQDEGGKSFIAERMGLAKDRRSFWHAYKFADPTTQEIARKDTYCEVLGTDIVVCSGVYRR
jgi:cytochrome c